MPEDDDTLSKLLRLKRYEQPPPEYFEKFLQEFQLRQRSELLRRPAWRIALDRLEALFDQFNLSRLSYAGASVGVLVAAGFFTVNMLQHPGGGTLALNASNNVSNPSTGTQIAQLSQSPLIDGSGVADVQVPVQVATASSPAYSNPAYTTSQFTLNPQMRVLEFSPNEASLPGATRLHPRYILDTRPASYEPPFSF